MTKIKLCGLSRPCDIRAANELLPDTSDLSLLRRAEIRVPGEGGGAEADAGSGDPGSRGVCG